MAVVSPRSCLLQIFMLHIHVWICLSKCSPYCCCCRRRRNSKSGRSQYHSNPNGKTAMSLLPRITFILQGRKSFVLSLVARIILFVFLLDPIDLRTSRISSASWGSALQHLTVFRQEKAGKNDERTRCVAERCPVGTRLFCARASTKMLDSINTMYLIIIIIIRLEHLGCNRAKGVTMRIDDALFFVSRIRGGLSCQHGCQGVCC